jgi:hypothetical protein
MDKYEHTFIIKERVNALWSTLCESCDLIDQSDALYFKRFLELQMFCWYGQKNCQCKAIKVTLSVEVDI